MRPGHAVLLSLVLHALLALGLSWMPVFVPDRPRPFTLELASPTEQEKQDARKALEKDPRQVVRQVELPDKMKSKAERKARFWSERDQTTLEETRAQASGLTANRSAQSPSAKQGVPGLPSDGGNGERRKGRGRRRTAKTLFLKPEALPRGEGDLASAAVQREQKQENQDDGESRPLHIPSFARLGGYERGESTVGESLPSDIKFGSLTALNTDRYVHYSFYARFEELFRHRWVKYVRSALFNYQTHERRTRGEQSWTTRLEIVLDRQGHFQRGILHEGCGLKALDAAPVEAMQEVRQVPNPPAEMVQKDGTVRLMYEFDVQFVAQYAAGSE